MHKLATLNGDRLVAIFSSKSADSKNAKASYDKELYDRCVEGLLIKSLELDNGSVEWIGALVKVCMGEISDLSYICKVYDISSSKVNLYKAIWSTDQALVQPLFEAIKNEIPLDFSESIYNLLNGDSEAVWNIIIRKINKDKTGKPLNNDISNATSNLKRILKNIFELTANDHIKREALTEVMK